MQVCYDYHLIGVGWRLERRGLIVGIFPSQSVLLRRMNFGPGVKAALTTGTMTMVFQKRALGNFMLLSPSLPVVAVLWAGDVGI